MDTFTFQNFQASPQNTTSWQGALYATTPAEGKSINLLAQEALRLRVAS